MHTDTAVTDPDVQRRCAAYVSNVTVPLFGRATCRSLLDVAGVTFVDDIKPNSTVIGNAVMRMCDQPLSALTMSPSRDVGVCLQMPTGLRMAISQQVEQRVKLFARVCAQCVISTSATCPPADRCVSTCTSPDPWLTILCTCWLLHPSTGSLRSMHVASVGAAGPANYGGLRIFQEVLLDPSLQRAIDALAKNLRRSRLVANVTGALGQSQVG